MNFDNLLENSSKEKIPDSDIKKLFTIFNLYQNLRKVSSKPQLQILRELKKLNSFQGNISDYLILIGLNSLQIKIDERK